MEQAYKLPCVRTVGLDAPFRWLAEGWRDMMRALVPSLFYGAVLAVVSFTLSNALINSNAAFWALALSCGFVFIAPVLAMGLYEAGRTLETGENPHCRKCSLSAAPCARTSPISGSRFSLSFALGPRRANRLWSFHVPSAHDRL